MPGSGLNIEQHLRALMGPDALIDRNDNGHPVIAPRTTDACSLVLETATAKGWRVRLAGNSTWGDQDGPADFTLSSRGLVDIEDVSASDLVATVQAGVDRESLRLALADHGAWWPVDPPGTSRTVGSVVATATSGPMRSGFGGIRDHVLGLTVVTANGRIVKSGGRVAKNVAGFDLTKLATGSFGAFGFITRVHLRLRTIPRADMTLVTKGSRDSLIHAAQEILAAGLTPPAIELMSPAVGGDNQWLLAVRLIGSDSSVIADRAGVKGIGTATWIEHTPHDGREFWQSASVHPVQHPVTIRMGTVITDLDRAIDLVTHHLDDESITASIAAGAVRWSGTAAADRLQLLRHKAAQIEMPMTIERAPWSVRKTLGHFGAYREGVDRLMESVRDTFDPNHTLVIALGGEA